jgi:hypothetical protein
MEHMPFTISLLEVVPCCFPLLNLLTNPPYFANQNTAPEDNKLSDKDMKVSIGNGICEHEQVDQAALQQDLCTVPTNLREHEIIDKLDRRIEPENSEVAELSHKVVSVPMEADVLVSATSYDNCEDNLVRQAELTEKLDLMSICPKEHADEELERDRTAGAGLIQDHDPVPNHSGDHVCETSYGHTDDEHAEVKQGSTSVTADVLDYMANTFDEDINTGKGKQQ